ncbi:hypothetical protein AaE_013134, partial [Aphanomyces astaci]
MKTSDERMRNEWVASGDGVLWGGSYPRTDCSLLKATCTYVWRVPVEQLSEMATATASRKSVRQPVAKWTPTKSDMQTYSWALSVDPHGCVSSRLVSFMEGVDDVIDENGLRLQIKDPTMLRTFVNVVAARVTPSYLRDRVKTVPANDLVAFADILREQLNRTHDADMVNQQRNNYGSKRGREERPAEPARDEVRPRFAPGRDDRGMLCFVCWQPGHMARECPNKKDGDPGDISWKK